MDKHVLTFLKTKNIHYPKVTLIKVNLDSSVTAIGYDEQSGKRFLFGYTQQDVFYYPLYKDLEILSVQSFGEVTGEWMKVLIAGAQGKNPFVGIVDIDKGYFECRKYNDYHGFFTSIYLNYNREYFSMMGELKEISTNTPTFPVAVLYNWLKDGSLNELAFRFLT